MNLCDKTNKLCKILPYCMEYIQVTVFIQRPVERQMYDISLETSAFYLYHVRL